MSDEEIKDLDGNVLVDSDETWDYYGSAETCSKCEEEFNLPSDFEFHEPCYSIPAEGLITCPSVKCSKLITDLKELRAHYNEYHQTIESFYCKKCNFRCCSFETITNHKSSNHTSSHRDSNLCENGELAESQNEINRYDLDAQTISRKEGERNSMDDDEFKKQNMYRVICGTYQCKRCQKTFDTIDQLAIHEPCFEERDSKYCPECSINFSNFKQFKTHLIEIHRKPRYFCCHCEEHFKEEKDVKEHSINYHNV